MNIYLDLETLPSRDPQFIADVAATITAPGQYKKPESIAEWLAENKEQATKELVSKTSFDGLYGSIACIAWAFDDNPVQVVGVVGDQTEAQMLAYFYDSVRELIRVEYHGGNTTTGLTVVGA